MKKAIPTERKLTPSEKRQQEFYLTIKDLSSDELRARQAFLDEQLKHQDHTIDTLVIALREARVEANQVAEKLTVIVHTLNSRR